MKHNLQHVRHLATRIDLDLWNQVLDCTHDPPILNIFKHQDIHLLYHRKDNASLLSIFLNTDKISEMSCTEAFVFSS